MKNDFLNVGAMGHASSVALGIALHIIFSGLLGVNLPRGTVPWLRSFSLFLENLI